MKKEQYITVSEFSKRANLTRQYVYKLLDTKLQDYTKTIDGKKMLDIQALELFNVNIENDKKTTLNDIIVDNLNNQIEQLQEQLNAKNEQIKALTEIVKQEQELFKNEQKLLSQEQSLHLATQQKLLLLEQKQREQEKVNKKQEHQEQPKEEDTQLDQPVESAKKQWWKFWK